MRKIIGVALLAAGVFLLVRGHDLSRSVDSQVKNIFTGSPSSQVTWYYLGGAICSVAGLVQLLRLGKK